MSLALHQLLAEAVDYAGLFPPACLPLQRVVQNYAEYLRSPDRWMLGRLIIPRLTLETFAAEADPYLAESRDPWRVSCLLPGLTERGAPGRSVMTDHWRAIAKFNAAHLGSAAGPISVDAVEIAVADPAGIELIAETLAVDGRVSMEVFVELPAEFDCSEHFQVLAKYEGLKLRSKVRTGGVSPDQFPACEQLAQFVLDAAAANVPFKATAGLHHPLRGVFPISYEHECSTVVMHGFLNLALAAAIARTGELQPAQMVTLLHEGSPIEIQFNDHFATWRGIDISLDQLSRTRLAGFRSFGSCSFIEPVEDLQQLGYLPLDE